MGRSQDAMVLRLCWVREVRKSWAVGIVWLDWAARLLSGLFKG